MSIRDIANREDYIAYRDSFMCDTVNPVPRKSVLQTKVIGGEIFYKTPYDGYWITIDGKKVLSDRQNREHCIKQFLSDGRYLSVFVFDGHSRSTRKKIRVHRLMMETFYGPCPEGYSVDHIDFNHFNNSIENLRYVSERDNARRVSCEISYYNRKVVVLKDGILYSFKSIKDFVKNTDFSTRSIACLREGKKPSNKARYIVNKYEFTNDSLILDITTNTSYVDMGFKVQRLSDWSRWEEKSPIEAPSPTYVGEDIV